MKIPSFADRATIKPLLARKDKINYEIEDD